MAALCCGYDWIHDRENYTLWFAADGNIYLHAMECRKIILFAVYGVQKDILFAVYGVQEVDYTRLEKNPTWAPPGLSGARGSMCLKIVHKRLTKLKTKSPWQKMNKTKD